MPEAWIDYHLPPGLIAQEPLYRRTDARLMVIDRAAATIEHRNVRDLPDILRGGDRLVVNDTKVLPAQLRGVRMNTGGRWQGLYLGDLPDGDWKIVCKTRGKIKPPEPITLLDRDGRPALKLWLLERLDHGQWRAHVESEEKRDDLLTLVGRVPLPPYIRGGMMVDSDVESYQTVYAKHAGAVAAPTAGLHFTDALISALKRCGVQFSAVTLHVGMGTFRPISTHDPAEHPMHSEWAELTEQAAAGINSTRADGHRVIAVGTTVTRVLETVAREGSTGVSAEENTRDGLRAWSGETDLFIRPPYEFRCVDGLLTNFHFPRTTLLLLVQAFGGSELIGRAYRMAVAEEYRFYSYGDAMLIL